MIIVITDVEFIIVLIRTVNIQKRINIKSYINYIIRDGVLIARKEKNNMPPETVPEDIREQYPCPYCGGNVELDKEDNTWKCLDCWAIMGENKKKE